MVFIILTTLAVISIYYSHYGLSYTYHNYCNGIALGTPPCNYLLEMIFLASSAVKNYWVYLGTIVSSFFLYAMNNLYRQLTDLRARYPADNKA